MHENSIEDEVCELTLHSWLSVLILWLQRSSDNPDPIHQDSSGVQSMWLYYEPTGRNLNPSIIRSCCDTEKQWRISISKRELRHEGCVVHVYASVWEGDKSMPEKKIWWMTQSKWVKAEFAMTMSSAVSTYNAWTKWKPLNAELTEREMDHGSWGNTSETKTTAPNGKTTPTELSHTNGNGQTGDVAIIVSEIFTRVLVSFYTGWFNASIIGV